MTIPGHVRAALNYNYLIDIFDQGSKKILSGDKVLVYSLKPNDYNFKSIAIPSDQIKFPEWVLSNFQIDIKTSEQKLIDSKLEGIFSAIGLDVPSPQSALTNSILGF